MATEEPQIKTNKNQGEIVEVEVEAVDNRDGQFFESEDPEACVKPTNDFSDSDDFAAPPKRSLKCGGSGKHRLFWILLAAVLLFTASVVFLGSSAAAGIAAHNQAQAAIEPAASCKSGKRTSKKKKSKKDGKKKKSKKDGKKKKAKKDGKKTCKKKKAGEKKS